MLEPPGRTGPMRSGVSLDAKLTHYELLNTALMFRDDALSVRCPGEESISIGVIAELDNPLIVCVENLKNIFIAALERSGKMVARPHSRYVIMLQVAVGVTFDAWSGVDAVCFQMHNLLLA